MQNIRQWHVSQMPKIKGTYRPMANISKTSWFGVGGLAEIMVRPESVEDLQFFLANKPFEMPVNILGASSNVIIRDGGVDGALIKLGRNFTKPEFKGGLLQVGASCLNYNLANYCLEHEISGLEFLVGIPGTIGGGVAMNAGAYGSDFSSVIEYVEAVDEAGNFHQIKNQDIGFTYRGNTLPENFIITSASFKLNSAKYEDIKKKMGSIIAARTGSQPIKDKTSGSTFKNPQGHKAWELIDAAGLRGFKIGGAMVSEKHCNFIINYRFATASDLENLGNHMIDKVHEKFGIKLVWEIQRIGKFV